MEKTKAQPAVPNRILRMPEVEALTGLKRPTIYRRITAGTFPRSVPLGGGSVGWSGREVDQWIAERIEARDHAAEAA